MFLFPLHFLSVSQCINLSCPQTWKTSKYSEYCVLACSLSGRALPCYWRLQEGFQPSKEVQLALAGTCTYNHTLFKPFGRSVSEQVFPVRDVIFHLLTSGMEIKKECVSVDHASGMKILLLILLRKYSTPLFSQPFFPNWRNISHLTCLLNLETPCCLRKADAMMNSAVSFQHLMLKQIPDIHHGTPNR